MSKILGIDTGTNSLGWAIVNSFDNGEYELLEHGTNIFQEGVKIEKGIESSKAAERTKHRASRKHYWRRKVRKIRLLTILIQNHLCPPVDKELLRNWRSKKEYPMDELFLEWQCTDDKHDRNPYHYRYLCLTQKFNLDDLAQRYILGRALYHLNQRRGFLSNRKESTKESDGNVKQGISQLSAYMANAGCEYLGEYFYKLYQEGKKIRSHYTARNEHYLKEFRAICEKQGLDDELVSQLEKAIFFQRPLKSQKQQVGKCTFEPKKTRCSVSHPLYEEFRMYSFINNIKIQTPKDYEMRPLNCEEKAQIIQLFYRKSKSSFSFEDIAKQIAGKKNYCHIKDRVDKPYKFNYYMDTNVSGCPVGARLVEIFGDNWLDGVCEVYTKADRKSRLEIMNDIWHALFFYDDAEKLKEYAKDRLQLEETDADKFSKISLPQDYASLSLNAICKILPYLKNYGLRYDEAVFLANLKEVLPSHVWGVKEMREAVIEGVIDVMHEEPSLVEGLNVEQRVKEYLAHRYAVDAEHLKKLYHPSMLEVYPRQRLNDDGVYQLGSPRISSVRNPMAMHSLFRLRKVVNLLLKEGKIDEDTTIHIEFSRDLNDANRRKAIQSHQRDNEKDRETCKKKIQELYNELNIVREPSDVDILKYQLWEEQGHKCVYTGDEIGLVDFLGSNPKYDIEHTVPRSVGGDSTKMNLTLCQSKFNREIKGAQLPSQLANHDVILQRIESWKEKYEKLSAQVRKLKGSHASDKDAKDGIIQKRHKLSLERDYWKGKYERFTMSEVPEGFSRRQGTDISVISKYARLYLKSVFRHVYIVKGIATSDFRKIWGIQDEYEKKSRENHAHHCIDAITIACIGPNEYGQLAHYYHELEDYEKYGMIKPQFPKPWASFVDDMKHIQDELLIAHYSKDKMAKTARRKVDAIDGKKKSRDMGDVAHGSLHLDTYYGAIQRDGEVKYVVRKSLAVLDEKDIKNIVDNEVRHKVELAVQEYGSLKKAVESNDIWMNKEKGVRIAKVRIFTGSVTRPINIRNHRDVSNHEYKRQFHVQNDRNYMMAIYIGADSKGKEKREFEIVNCLDAANHYKYSNINDGVDYDVVPISSKKGYPLAYKLKIGTRVLLFEESPEEVWNLDKKDVQKRLYKVQGLSSMVVSGCSYGVVGLVHHQVAKPSSEIKLVNGVFKHDEQFRFGIKMLHTQLKALVEGVDFELTELGEIVRLF